jgi:hypothetical protein
MTLNSFIYNDTSAVERVTQGQRTTVGEYRNQATRHITEFESAFAGTGEERVKFIARI